MAMKESDIIVMGKDGWIQGKSAVQQPNTKKRIDGKRVMSEEQTRNKRIQQAKEFGFHEDLMRIYNRYDNLLKGSTNEKERKQIAIMGNVEIHRLFNFRDALVVDGEEILPADEE
jgi:hypothetical protein